jgi:hypothetical protein
MSIQLTVIHDFADYVRGEVIKAEEEIEAILGSTNHTNVVKVAAPDVPAITAPAEKIPTGS